MEDVRLDLFAGLWLLGAGDRIFVITIDTFQGDHGLEGLSPLGGLGLKFAVEELDGGFLAVDVRVAEDGDDDEADDVDHDEEEAEGVVHGFHVRGQGPEEDEDEDLGSTRVRNSQL